ncbi:translation initiation factor IF-2 [Rosa sericea]
MRGGTAIGIGRKLANPSSFSISRQTLLPFSTSSNSGGGGGRGRGRGGPTPPAPSLFNYLADQFPPQPDSESDPPAPLPAAGHGRGKPLSQPPPSFASGIKPGSSAGRGGSGHVQPPVESREGDDSGLPKKPVFFRREDAEENLPAGLMTALGGTGRGRPISGPAAQSVEESRQIGAPVEPKREPRKPKLTREEAVKQAMGILQQGGGEGPEVDGGGGRGRGGERGMRGRGGGRGRGRGGRGRREGEGDRRRQGDGDGGIAPGLYLGDNADGEKLAKRLGPEVMNQLTEAFEDMSNQVLPSPLDDAYVDALDTNCMIEFEPEYLMGEFNQNPDIDEKPPIPLRDALEKMKPFLMAYEGIQSQEEWEEAMKETMERVPLLKEIVDQYSGPDRVTAKKQQEELERVAKTLPAKVPDSVKQFTDRVVLSLQGNPGWGFHRKCQFMDKLTEKVSKHYK